MDGQSKKANSDWLSAEEMKNPANWAQNEFERQHLSRFREMRQEHQREYLKFWQNLVTLSADELSRFADMAKAVVGGEKIGPAANRFGFGDYLPTAEQRTTLQQTGCNPY